MPFQNADTNLRKSKKETAGYIIRQKEEADKRFFHIFLTEKGRQITEELFVPAYQKLFELYHESLTDDEYTLILELLEKILHRLDNEIEQQGGLQ